MLAHEQTRALGLVQATPRGDIRLVGLPVSFDKVRPEPRLGPPALGEHTTILLGGREEPTS